MIPVLVLIGAALATLAQEPTTTAGEVQPAYEPGPGDLVTVDDWPPIGKWMIDSSLQPAGWLGERVEGKALREPINVILVDAAAASAEEAIARLTRACDAAGYKSRRGHSSGYHGYLGGTLFPQLPATPKHAFANEPFEFHNNHGRVFGPFRIQEGWLFLAALSRERLNPLSKAKHLYVSFIQARDDFARKLNEATSYKISGQAELANAITADPALTTGDHDGKATVLRARR